MKVLRLISYENDCFSCPYKDIYARNQDINIQKKWHYWVIQITSDLNILFCLHITYLKNIVTFIARSNEHLISSILHGELNIPRGGLFKLKQKNCKSCERWKFQGDFTRVQIQISYYPLPSEAWKVPTHLLVTSRKASSTHLSCKLMLHVIISYNLCSSEDTKQPPST